MCSFKGKISQLTSTLPKGGLSDWYRINPIFDILHNELDWKVK